MQITWANGQVEPFLLGVPKLKGLMGEGLQEDYATFPDNSTTGHYHARSAGYGVITVRSTYLENNKDTHFQLTNWQGTETIYKRVTAPDSAPAYEIEATAWNDIYAKCALYASAASLLFLVLEKVASLVMYIWRLFIRDP